jgi:hypothetical protein
MGGDSKPLQLVVEVMSQVDDSPASSSRPRRSLAARAGVALMATSFLVYLVYGLLPFLPLAPSELAGVAIGASLTSWGMFSLGAALVGRDAGTLLRRALDRGWARVRGRARR